VAPDLIRTLTDLKSEMGQKRRFDRRPVTSGLPRL